MDLAEALAVMRPVGMRYAASVGPPESRADGHFTRLDALVQEPGVLEALLDGAGARWSTLERRVQIAFVVPPLIARLTRVACGCLMLGVPVPRMRARDIVVRFGDTGLVQEMRLIGPSVTSIRGNAERIRDELVRDHLAGLIEHVGVAAGRCRPSLWGAVADGLSGACLELGRALGDEQAGRRAGERLVEFCRPPLRRPARYLDLTGGGRTEVAVDLQSCCLSHRLANGVRCDTCPMRPQAERREILGRRLAERPAPTPVLAGHRLAWA